MKRQESISVNTGDPELGDLPVIVMFGDVYHRTARPVLPPHYNSGIEICLCSSGIYEWDVEGDIVELRPGETSVTRPWQRHSGRDSLLGPGRLTWIILRAGVVGNGVHRRLVSADLSALIGSEAEGVLSAFSANDDCFLGEVPGIREALEQIGSELRNRRPGRNASIRAAVVNLVVGVSRRLADLDGTTSPETTTRGVVPRGVVEVLREVSHNPGAEWTASGLANRAGMGITAFTRWCRKLTGRSPRWYVLEQRLEWARGELAGSDRSVGEIAGVAGFSSSQHFSSAFRKLFGRTPSGFRNRTREPEL